MQERRVFSSLDGLRGIAALAVLVRHTPDETLANWLPGSYLAVDLFFVLSGFVLAHSYLSRLRTTMSTIAFMRARLIRLYPLYLLGTLLTIPFIFHTLARSASNAFSIVASCTAFAALFLPTPASISPDIHPYPLNHPAWSLFFELVANALLAVLASRLTTRVIAALVIGGLGLLAATATQFHGLDAGWQFAGFWGGFGRVLYSFFAGLGIYQLWRVGSLRWVRLPMPIAALLMLFAFAGEPQQHREIYDVVVAALVFPLLVLGAARAEPGALLARFCSVLGRASYAIYVLQVAVIEWVIFLVRLATHGDLVSYGMQGTLFIMVCAIAAALLLDKYVDSPSRSVLTGFFKRGHARAVN